MLAVFKRASAPRVVGPALICSMLAACGADQPVAPPPPVEVATPAPKAAPPPGKVAPAGKSYQSVGHKSDPE